MDGEYEFNSKVLVWLGLIGVLFVLIFFPYSAFEKPKVNETINITTPTPTPTAIIKYIYVTPTPDNGIYYAGEYVSGTRKLARPYSWIKYNATGYKTLHGTIYVYDYKKFKKVHWYNPADNQYYPMSAAVGKEFLIVFYQVYSDNEYLGDSYALPMIERKTMVVQIGNNLMSYYDYPLWRRIKELEDTYNHNDDLRVKAFGQMPMYSRSLEYKSTAGMYSKEIDTIYGGRSNAEDGYLFYEIPEGVAPEDITVRIGMGPWGSPGWVLKL